MRQNNTHAMPKQSHHGDGTDKTQKPAAVRLPRQSRTKARTSNACEACKRRKTKCTGFPSPCDVCQKAETYCNFNPKLDTRRKVAYSSSTVQDRQQFMITALLQTIKHSSEPDLQHLMGLIRGPSRPDAVAECLQKHFKVLQSKNILAKVDVDNTDVVSFGLQGLCGHRKGRPRPNGKGTEDTADSAPSESQISPFSDDEGLSTSSLAAIDEDDGMEENSSLASDNRPLDTYGFSPAEMFDIAVNEPQYHSEVHALGNDEQHALSAMLPRQSFSPSSQLRMPFFNDSSTISARSNEHHHDLFASAMNMQMHSEYNISPSMHDVGTKYPRNQAFDASMYYYCLANGIRTIPTQVAASK